METHTHIHNKTHTKNTCTYLIVRYGPHSSRKTKKVISTPAPFKNWRNVYLPSLCRNQPATNGAKQSKVEK